MLYKHKRTSGLTCEVTEIKRKGKQEVYCAETKTAKFMANKEKFLEEWEPFNPSEMEYAYIHRTDGMNLTKGEWIAKKSKLCQTGLK